MGSIVLYGSGDAEPLFGTPESTYTQIWSKSGDQDNDWHKATITIDSTYLSAAHFYPQWLKFVYTSGSGSEPTGDMALDNVTVVAGGVPTSMPTEKSTATVESFDTLLAAMDDLHEVTVTGSITFTKTITLNNIKGLIIESKPAGAAFRGGNALSTGGFSGALFDIIGESDVTFVGVDFKV